MERAAFTGEQCAALLDEITQTARQIKILARLVFERHDDADEADAIASAIEVLAGRVGWFAEIAEAGSGHRRFVPSDAHDWLMPDRCQPQAMTVQGRA